MTTFGATTQYLGLPGFDECPCCRVSRLALIQCLSEPPESPNRAMGEALLSGCPDCARYYTDLVNP